MFSNRQDRIYMGVGTITSIMAGITFPFFLMYFGQITDMFNDVETAADKGLQILYKFLIIGVLYWVLSMSYLIQLLLQSTAGAIQDPLKACV